MHNLDMRVVHITPQMAKEWLEKNTRNRPIIASSVKHYAAQMRNRKWRLTGEAIKFDKEGNLVDGQCRLTACVQSGVSFTSLVVGNVPEEAFNVMDQGSIRTPAHAFGRDGKARYSMLAAAVRLVWILENKKKVQFSGKLTIDESYEILEAHPNLEKSVELATSWYSPSMPLPPSVVAGFMSVCSTATKTISLKSLEFWKAVSTGNDIKAGSPEERLRVTLLNAKLKGEPFHRDTVNALCIKAYNAYIAGETMYKLSYNPKTEKFPVLKI